MVNLPTGTVTLLFTDIEGSMQRLQRLGGHAGDLLPAHAHLAAPLHVR